MPNRLLSRVTIVTAVFVIAFSSVETALSYALAQRALAMESELNDPTLAITKHGRATPPLGVGAPITPYHQYGEISEETRKQAYAPGVNFPVDGLTADPNPTPDSATEDLSKRTPRSKTYNNPDGSTTVTHYTRDSFYQEGGQAKQLSSRIIADHEGSAGENGSVGLLGAGLGTTPLKGFKAEGGPLKARFHELSPQRGVSLTFDGQGITMQPIGGRAGVMPTRETHGSTDAVVYSDVWRGVDLVYEYHGDVVKELIVVRQKPATNSFSFDIRGATLRHSPTTPGVIEGIKGGKVVFVLPELTVLAKDIGPVNDTGAAYSLDGSTVTVTLNQSWFDGLTDQNYPVVIDPTIGISNNSNNYVDYKSDGYVCASSSCWLYAGNLNDNGIKYWRTVLHIPFSVPAGQTATTLARPYTPVTLRQV